MRSALGTHVCVVAFAILGAGVGGSLAEAAGTRVALPKLRELVEKQTAEGAGGCAAFVNPVAVAGRYALVVSGVRCREGDDRERKSFAYKTKKGYLAVVDWKRMALVGEETEHRSGADVLTLADIGGDPGVLLAEEGNLVLRIFRQDGVEAYRWPCPEPRCPWVLQAQVIQETRFPLEPIRVAVTGQGQFLVRVFDLHPPKEGAGAGWIHEVDQLGPLASWSQEFRSATNLDEEVKRVYLHANIFIKYASMLPLLDKEFGAMAQEAADRYVENAPRGMSLLFTPQHGLLLGTQQPFTLTRVDSKTGAFKVLSLSEFGAHVRPLSLEGNLSLLAAFPENSNVVRLVVKGTVCEGAEQYKRHTSEACPHPGKNPVTDEELCCHQVAALVRYDLRADETDWQLWDEQEKGRDVSRLVVEVGKTGATCLVALLDSSPATLVRQTCPRR